MGVFGRRVMGRDKIIFSYPMFGVRPDRIKLSYPVFGGKLDNIYLSYPIFGTRLDRTFDPCIPQKIGYNYPT